MGYCRSCGVHTDAGEFCSTCSQRQAGGGVLSAQSLAQLYAEPVGLVRYFLGRVNLNLSLIMIGSAFGLQLVSRLLWFWAHKSSFNSAVLMPLVEWLLVAGAWVWALSFLAGRFGRTFRWESAVSVYGALAIPSGLLAVLWPMLSLAKMPYLASALSFIPSLFFWSGLYLVCRFVLDGDDREAFKYALFVAAVPAATDFAWTILRTYAF